MVTPLISLDKSLTGYLSISDITTYSAGQRDLTGIMMFWSKDAFATDVNLDQSNADQWTVPALAQKTYNVYGFYCYVWAAANNVNIVHYDIVFYQGYFYIKTTVGTINPSTSPTNPAVDSTDFTPLVVGGSLTMGGVTTTLTAADIYALVVNAVALADTNSAVATSTTFIDRDAFTLSKQDCLSWLVSINIDCTVARVRLLNYDGSILEDNIAVTGTTVNVDLSAYGDGSYTVEIAYITQVQQGLDIPDYWTIVSIPILEVCNANACYTKLFKYVLCKCDDPCNDCEDLKAKWHDLHTIRELITSINNMVYLERSQFIGLYPITTSQADLLSDIGQMIDKLKLVTDRCGLCGKGDSNNVTC